MTLSPRTTLYTAWGDWLPRLCVLLAIALLLVARFDPGRRKIHQLWPRTRAETDAG